MKYRDFDLLLTPFEQGYRASVLNPSVGEGIAHFELPFTAQELKIFRLEAAQSRRGVRRMESSDMRAAREFGGRLFEAVFSGEVRENLLKSLEGADAGSTGLRLRMHLSRAPDLAALPWEYLYDPNLGRFFALSVTTPLVRYMDLPERIKPLPVKPPVRVLVVIASPTDKPPLDVEGEWTRLSAALAGLVRDGMVEVDRLPVATYGALLKRLRLKPYHIFHFVGHGEFNEECREGVLLFEDDERRGYPVSAAALGTLLHDQPSLRLAILNSCEGARTSSSDPFSGTAQTLLQQGIPAVIAMQSAITDEASHQLAYTFYDAIADGYPVDAALTDARKSIFGDGSVEWGTPVLYMRSPDGRIFDVDRLSTEIRRREQKSGLARDAEELVAGQNWTAAVDRLEKLTALDPHDRDAAAKLDKARQELNLAALISAGREHRAAGRWREAVDALVRARELGERSPEIDALLSEARSRLSGISEPAGRDRGRQAPGAPEEAPRSKKWAGVVQVADLYHQATSAMEAGDWPAAVDRLRDVLALDPDHAEAQERLTRAERQKELGDLYERAQRSLAAGCWRDAVEDLRRVREKDAGFRDVTGLLERAGRELDRQEREDSGGKGPIPAPVPPPRRKIGTSLKVGGCAAAATITLCTVAVVGVMVLPRSTGRTGPAAVTAEARPPSSDPEKATAPPPGKIAGDPPVSAKVEPAVGPAASADQQGIVSAIREATRAEIQAYRFLNPAPLYGVYTGQALTMQLGFLQAFAASTGSAGYAVAKHEAQEYQGFQFSPDGARAQVKVTDRWSVEIRSVVTGACVGEIPGYEISHTYSLQRAGGGWKIYSIQHHNQAPPPQPCGNG
ncbi:MAG: CHAT domain-containing protein [Thermoanaerobaculia bacterium]